MPEAPSNLDGEPVRLLISAGPLIEPVVGRVVAVLADRAGLPVDRLTEALAVCESIAAHAPDLLVDGRLSVELEVAEGELQLRTGPLTGEGAEELVERTRLPGVGEVLEKLAEVRVAAGDGGEWLDLSFTERGDRGSAMVNG